MLKVCLSFCTKVVDDGDGDGGDAVLALLGGGDAADTLLGGGEDFTEAGGGDEEEGGGEAEVVDDWVPAPLMVMPVPA